MSGSGGGGTPAMGTKVFLNVYDLSPANDYLCAVGLGLHHSGIEVSGSEYSFASGAGVFQATPRDAPGARFRQQYELGAFEGGSPALHKALDVLRDDFGPHDYNLIRRNCNHFANALVWKLLGKTLPGHVNRLADIGVCCSCLLPRKLLETAPVGDESSSASSSSSSSSYLVKAGNRSNASNSTYKNAPSFQGSGARLGGVDSTSSNASAASPAEQKGLLGRWSSSSSGGAASPTNHKKNGSDDLTDRREKARKAALARLDLKPDKEQS